MKMVRLPTGEIVSENDLPRKRGRPKMDFWEKMKKMFERNMKVYEIEQMMKDGTDNNNKKV